MNSTTQPTIVNHAVTDRRRARGSRNGWFGGAILLTAGILLMVKTINGYILPHWWALFILIPALANFSEAGRILAEKGRLTRPARAALLAGLLLVYITAVLLLGWSWTLHGPLMLILVGCGILVSFVLVD